METLGETKVGLFPIAYQIGGNMPGAPVFTIHMTVYTPAKTINGTGLISQAVHPLLEVPTQLHGNYTYMTVMPPHPSHILLVAVGYPVVDYPVTSVHGPMQQPNAEFRISLDEDWQQGVANYKFYDGSKWVEITDAPVKILKND